MKIAVLMGGVSSEREVSLASGRNIATALRENGHDVLALDTILPIEQLKRSIEPNPDHLKNGESNLIRLVSDPVVRAVDFAFIALHGGSGENGSVQSVLEMLGYRYNGSDHEGCAIAMDKIVTKIIFENLEIPTPEWCSYDLQEGHDPAVIANAIAQKMTLPLVIKPAHEGSTVGLTIVRSIAEIEPAVVTAMKYNSSILVEKYIPGREITVAILGDEALPLVEICPKHGIYDYECKYTSGMSQYIVPAEVDPTVARRIQELAVSAIKSLRVYGYGRFDLRLTPDNQPIFLEFNSLPGMTATSLVPKAAKAVGVNFNELLEKIIELGLRR
ncbi:MAG: D-alanine--D-alanine ligase [Candidatus Neomarinimicrobiota bacterium]|jgi:D-alanine-D-alanine ligase|nr:D-alanine--D-alanine ligase [Candidatus Neomarinimicrobiota bacterium]